MALAQATGESPVFTFRGLFRQIYGIELDAEAELFMAGTAPCTGDEFPVRVYDCSMLEVPWSGRQWRFSAMMDCDDEAVAGGIVPGSPSNYIVRSVVVDVPADGMYTLGITGDEFAVDVGLCGGCPWSREDVYADPEAAVTAAFAAGQHFVRVVGPAEGSSEVTVTLDPATP